MTGADAPAPYRTSFDNARDPYTARNALGIDTVLAGYQPLDADLTAIAALTGTNTIYYRSAANTWSAVTVSTGLAFSGGNLTATGTGTSAFTQVAVQKFTASGTYTPTSGMKYCIIELVGGGGGGGGASGVAAQYYGGGGGGSGGYARKIVSAATIGASQAVTIGALGGGGSTGGSGSAGGTTSVGSLCSAAGGSGGGWGNGGGAAGAGGGATVGDILIQGGPGVGGEYRQYTGSSFSYGGAGGSSYFGGGGVGTIAASNGANGNAGGNYGSGGSGGTSANSAVGANGGSGTAGVVLITEFI